MFPFGGKKTSDTPEASQPIEIQADNNAVLHFKVAPDGSLTKIDPESAPVPADTAPDLPKTNPTPSAEKSRDVPSDHPDTAAPTDAAPATEAALPTVENPTTPNAPISATKVVPPAAKEITAEIDAPELVTPKDEPVVSPAPIEAAAPEAAVTKDSVAEAVPDPTADATPVTEPDVRVPGAVPPAPIEIPKTIEAVRAEIEEIPADTKAEDIVADKATNNLTEKRFAEKRLAQEIVDEYKTVQKQLKDLREEWLGIAETINLDNISFLEGLEYNGKQLNSREVLTQMLADHFDNKKEDEVMFAFSRDKSSFELAKSINQLNRELKIMGVKFTFSPVFGLSSPEDSDTYFEGHLAEAA